jgi:hypothetical protein
MERCFESWSGGLSLVWRRSAGQSRFASGQAIALMHELERPLRQCFSNGWLKSLLPLTLASLAGPTHYYTWTQTYLKGGTVSVRLRT